jgi:hypothetical protein
MSERLPRLVRLYIVQSAIGFAVAAVFVALLLGLNVANLWHLVTHTSAGPLAVVLLWLFNGIVFSGVQFGIAVMRMAESEGSGGGSRLRPAPLRTQVHAASPFAVPVEADRPSR